jgi:phage terminase large subunit GpA-like protein
MVIMNEPGMGDVRAIAPLPPFVTADDILADELVLLDPPSRITVTDAAEQAIRVEVAGVWQGFDRRVVPYTVEPADITQSRKFTAVCFVGPSQSGKSEMLKTVALHAPLHEPSPVQVIHMTKTDADAWVEEKLDPTIRNSPQINALLGRGPSDSTFSRKRFRGMRLTVGYPKASQLSSRTQRMVLLTDYDHMRQQLGAKDRPEGTPFGLARRRVLTFMSRGCVLVESTPTFPVSDASWHVDKAAPHMMPPVSAGIVNIYNEGTRGRWYWSCPECSELFEPTFARLVYDEALDPGQAGEAAEMGCPHCGALIAHRHKVELNRRAMTGQGGWLHEAETLDDQGRRELVGISDPRMRRTTIASYALNGVAATFANWADLVTAYENARRSAQLTGDDTDLGQVTYTQIGLPHLPRAMTDEGDLGLQFLKDHLGPFQEETCPEWARFVTVTVDVQKGYFPVMVTAWGPHGERVIIARFDLSEPPASAPRAGKRRLDPARYIEDWDVLLPLMQVVYPVHGAQYALRPLALAVDFQGEPGVSDRADAFWQKRRSEGAARRWYISRGWGGFALRDRVWYDSPERGSKGKKARGIKLLNMATDRLKDSVIAALQRTDDGAGRYHVPDWLGEDHLIELTAEQRLGKGWEKRPGMQRNETLDLSVQALALAEHKGLMRVDWDSPPDWAALGPENINAVVLTGDGVSNPEARAEPAAIPPTIKYLRR